MGKIYDLRACCKDTLGFCNEFQSDSLRFIYFLVSIESGFEI